MNELIAYQSSRAPKALGNYTHAMEVNGFLFVCGMGPRDPKTNQVPGLTLGENGEILEYDIRLETIRTLENIKVVLEDAGSDMNHVVEMNVFLRDMKDFQAMNEVYNEYFHSHQPVRTTLGVVALPGPISVEIKAVAVRKE